MADPRVGLICSVENARYRETERARRMLRRVRGQIANLGLGPAFQRILTLTRANPGLVRKLYAG
jgi:hypothetical protein